MKRRRLRAAAALAVAALCGGCEAPPAPATPEFTIVVTGSVSPSPLPFAGTYQYDADGQTVTRDLSAERSFATTFSADSLRYVRVVAMSREGMYRLEIQRDGDLVFDSAARPASEPLLYSSEVAVAD